MLRYLCLLVLLSASLLVGCANLTEARFNGGVGLSVESAVIVPFSEPKDWKFYGESQRGQFLAEALKGWATSHWNVEFPDSQELKKALDLADRSNKEQISAKDWKVFLRGLGAKYAVVGEIDEFSLTDPKKVGLLSASIRTSYRVVNLESGKVAYERNRKSVRYGDYGSLDEEEIPHVDLGPMEQSRRKVEGHLVRKMAAEIGEELYGYYPE